MKRRYPCLILILILSAAMLLPAGNAPAEMKWREDTPAQKILRTYIENVNNALLLAGEKPVNTMFEMYRELAVFGITAEPDAETPESVEITFSLTYDTINTMQLRVSDLSRFPAIGAAFLQALDPDKRSVEDSLRVPTEKAQKAFSAPADSFEEEIEELNGDSPRVYYAYYPNEFHDGTSWLQMTIVFPLAGLWDNGTVVEGALPTKGPDTYSGNDAEYEGYFSDDDFSHLDVFMTETPEPDSAAAEYDPYH